MLLIGALPTSAAKPKPRELERMAKKLERLFQPLGAKISASELEFKSHGDGYYSLSYPLRQFKGIDGIDALGIDKPIVALNIGHMASEPTNPGNVVTAVVADPETEYNLWWAVVNQNGEDLTRKTSVMLVGPEGFDMQVSDDVVYPANAVSLFWFNPETPFEAIGIYTYRLIVKTGGKMYYRFWVEPLVAE